MKRILLEVETSFQDLKFTGMHLTFMTSCGLFTVAIGSVYTVLLTRALERWRIENWSNLTGFVSDLSELLMMSLKNKSNQYYVSLSSIPDNSLFIILSSTTTSNKFNGRVGGFCTQHFSKN